MVHGGGMESILAIVGWCSCAFNRCPLDRNEPLRPHGHIPDLGVSMGGNHILDTKRRFGVCIGDGALPLCSTLTAVQIAIR